MMQKLRKMRSNAKFVCAPVLDLLFYGLRFKLFVECALREHGKFGVATESQCYELSCREFMQPRRESWHQCCQAQAFLQTNDAVLRFERVRPQLQHRNDGCDAEDNLPVCPDG